MSALGPKADAASSLTRGPVRPSKRTCANSPRQVRLVPCVDGSELARAFFTFAGWSVQPCVRPLDAVHMTAGHNALRGSGLGQKPAFDNNAMAASLAGGRANIAVSQGRCVVPWILA